MGRILIVNEEICGDCKEPMGETVREAEDLCSYSGNGNTKVKRRKILSRCKKCQPIFEEKMKQLKEAGRVQVVPFGVSGQKKEEKGTTLRDFIGRDKNRQKKEAKHEHGHP